MFVNAMLLQMYSTFMYSFENEERVNLHSFLGITETKGHNTESYRRHKCERGKSKKDHTGQEIQARTKLRRTHSRKEGEQAGNRGRASQHKSNIQTTKACDEVERMTFTHT